MRRAFTLVELIVVVIIIGILLSVGIPQYRKALERSRGAEGYAGLAHIQGGEKIYYADNLTYLAGNNTISAPYNSSMTFSSPQQKTLDIILPQSGWYFDVSVGTDDFTATAVRIAGPCAGDSITINRNGTRTESWKDCVDNL
jgi:prepilin-type N-terminal cleavage/methylation domain-containing protein